MTDQTSRWTNTFLVGVYVCEMTYNEGEPLKAEWRPDVPRRLAEHDWSQYRAGRDALLAEVAAATGMNTLVVEL